MKAKAKEAAFYKGTRLRVGDAFEFEGDALPKWAVAESVPVKAKAAPGGIDTKPAKTQAAVKAKTEPGAENAASLV